MKGIPQGRYTKEFREEVKGLSQALLKFAFLTSLVISLD